jgi:hypothetical protein
LQPLIRMRVLPGFQLLVRVLDHHHGRIDHRADGDGDAPSDMMLALIPW